MSEDGQPQVAPGKQVQQTQHQACQKGIHHSGDPLVGMSCTKGERAQHQGEDDAGASVASQIRQAVEKITAEEQLFDEGGFRPGDDEEEQQGRQAAFYEAELGQVDCFAGEGLQDGGDQQGIQDLVANADEQGQTDGRQPFVRSPETDIPPAHVPQAQGSPCDDEQGQDGQGKTQGEEDRSHQETEGFRR